MQPRWPSDHSFDVVYKNVLTRLGMSAPRAVGWLRGIRQVTQAAENRKRADVAQQLHAAEDPKAKQLNAAGHCAFAPWELPGSREVVALCRDLAKVARDRKDEIHSPQGYGERGYFRLILSGQEYLRHQAIVELATSEPLIRAVAGYLGGVPWLTSATLMWTLPNDQAFSSQLFHFDQKDRTQLKLFLLIEDVGPENGPTGYYDLADSTKLKTGLGAGYRKRLKDEKVFSLLPRERLHSMTGAAGAAHLLDTCRCLHFGSRGNKRDRLVLILTFNQAVVPRGFSDYGEESAGPVELPARPLTPLQQMVLRLAPA